MARSQKSIENSPPTLVLNIHVNIFQMDVNEYSFVHPYLEEIRIILQSHPNYMIDEIKFKHVPNIENYSAKYSSGCTYFNPRDKEFYHPNPAEHLHAVWFWHYEYEPGICPENILREDWR